MARAAILTPTPPIAWGTPESALEERFPLLAPATTESLKETVLALALDSGVERRDWKEESSGETPPPFHPERARCASSAARWASRFTAGSVPARSTPTAVGDLTVHLGALPEVGANLVTESNLLALARLPWFRQGAIPEPVRAELIADLPEEAKTGAVELLKLLTHDLPAEGSPARRKFDAEIAVQQQAWRRRIQPPPKRSSRSSCGSPGSLRREARDRRAHREPSAVVGGLQAGAAALVAGALRARAAGVLHVIRGIRLAVTLAAVAGAFLFLPREPIPPSRSKITPDSAVLQVGKTTGRIDASSSKTVKYTAAIPRSSRWKVAAC